MLTLQDCIALSDLTPEEVDAIAEDLHLPGVIAAELGAYLMHLPDGEKRIRRIILDDLSQAWNRGDLARAANLKLVLRHFIEEHRQQPRPVGAAEVVSP
jgi:hypothetical protein